MIDNKENIVWNKVPGRNCKEVHCSHTFAMNGEELFPSGTGRTGGRLADVLANSVDGHEVSKAAHFPEDSSGVPGRIFGFDLLDESDCFWKQPWMSGAMCCGDPSPEEGE